MTFTQAIASCFSQYATFQGRAPRSEFWFFRLFFLLLVLGSCCLIPAFGVGVVAFCAASLVCFIPDIAVTVRRLHDTDHSGWWFWIFLIPLAGVVILLVFLCTRGSWGDNRFGPDPLAGQAPPPYPPPRVPLADELSRLAKLRDEGTISDEEFQRLKTKLI